MPSIHTDVSVDVHLTPQQLAELFASCDASQQAEFFNHLDFIASPWLPFQLEAITTDHGLTLAGRRVMQSIGDYSHWGLVPRSNS